MGGSSNASSSSSTAHGVIVSGEPDFVTERIAEIGDVVGIDPFRCWTRMVGSPRTT